MSKTVKQAKKIHTTVKIFLFCFLFYFITNVYSK